MGCTLGRMRHVMHHSNTQDRHGTSRAAFQLHGSICMAVITWQYLHGQEPTKKWLCSSIGYHFCMSVMQATAVGGSCSGAVGNGDLMLVSAGPSYYASVNTVASEAKRAGTIAFLLLSLLLHLEKHWRIM